MYDFDLTLASVRTAISGQDLICFFRSTWLIGQGWKGVGIDAERHGTPDDHIRFDSLYRT
jgi:hypothetical protein